MEALAGVQLKLTAKLAGGASMFSATPAAHIGQQNLMSCERLLKDLGIPIAAQHCGGGQGRRMSLDTGSGRVVIELAGQKPIEL
jgi:chemotaxis protein CheD